MEDKIKELEKQIAELKEQIKKQEEPGYKHWRAEDNGNYWYMNDCGWAYIGSDSRDSMDNRNYAIGNYFKTRGEAELYNRKLIAYQIIKDDAKGFEPDWDDEDQRKWDGRYDFRNEVFYPNPATYCRAVGLIYFATKDDVEDSQKKHEAEWKLLLGIED